MTKFKVGDVVQNVSDFDDYIPIGNRYIVTSANDVFIEFNDDVGDVRVRASVLYKLHSRPSEAPPTTIEHEGYTYTRGERVLPDWLKDGAWVVSKKGVLRKVWDDGKNGVYLTSDKKQDILYTEELRDQYRPHEPSDYKWGDWAMYEGKKVFVMGYLGSEGIEISKPPIYRKALDGWTIALPSQLTPTHAP